MFWGLIVKSNRKYSQKVVRPFHLSQAVLDVTTTTGNRDVRLFLSSTKCDDSGNIVTDDYILCILKKSGSVQVPLNLIFSEGDDISFRSVGGTVHLSGYLMDDRNFQESSDEDETYDGRRTEKRQMAQESSGSDNEGGSGDEEDGSDDQEGAEGGDGSDDQEGAEDEVNNESENDSSEEQPIPPPVKRPKLNGISKSKAVKNKKRTLDCGIIVEDLRGGKGTVTKSGDEVEMSFYCYLQSNKKPIHKLNGGNGYIKYTVGEGQVQAWNIGIVGMKGGGKRKIICPPGTAHGSNGYLTHVPAMETLEYTIELKRVLPRH
ncbi:hypothetical protein HA402_015063 [Bradysia odoriphaga]|nr:hypothetical protein HA402_015063 [Bradysia odoriphaga]